MERPVVASIGTTHPWNIAGVGLDARVCAEYGVNHAMAVVAVSAQDAQGLHDVFAIPPHAVIAQLASLPRDVAAYRIGALVSSDTVHIVADFVRKHADSVPFIVDPVIGVSLGGDLSTDEDLESVLRDELLTLPVIVTPNVPEAAQLLSMHIDTVADTRAAARRFIERGARAAYVKGGHLSGDPVDVLVSGSVDKTFSGSRLNGTMRGSGCTFAAALSAELALGRDLAAAAAGAREYTRAKIGAQTMRGGLQVAF